MKEINLLQTYVKLHVEMCTHKLTVIERLVPVVFTTNGTKGLIATQKTVSTNFHKNQESIWYNQHASKFFRICKAFQAFLLTSVLTISHVVDSLQ